VDPDAPARTAHALFYPPTNRPTAPGGELPPLLVVIHGGPRPAHSRCCGRLQYWTSRGFAV